MLVFQEYVPSDNVLVLPAKLVTQTANGAVLAAGAESEHTESLGNDDALLLVVRGRNTLKHLESLHRGGTTGGLVGNHATHGSVEDAGGSAEVEGTSTSRVETGHLAKEGLVLDYTESALCSISIPPFIFISNHMFPPLRIQPKIYFKK